MTAPAITTLRSTIATLLNNPTKWQVFDHPPAAPLPNSIIIWWNDPMLEPTNNTFFTISPKARLKLTFTTEYYDNQAALINIENLMITAMNQLVASGLIFNITLVSHPLVLGDDGGRMVSIDVEFETLTSWS